MKFKKIVAVDKTGLRDWAKNRLKENFTNTFIEYNDLPTSKEEIVNRIDDADCALVSWHTNITKNVIQACPNLKYIGMCCSLYNAASANVDIEFAANQGITVKGVRDYGDEGLIEFILSELIRLVKGLGEYQWKDEPVELGNRKLGIIGLGTTGKMLADRAQAFGIQVYYHSRTRKTEAENHNLKYLSLDELLQTCEVISTHLPKHTIVLQDHHFTLLGNGKILINTSLGLTFTRSGFLDWIKGDKNYAIFDKDGIGEYEEEFSKIDRIISSGIVSGWTAEAVDRLSKKVIINIEEFLR